MIPPEQHRQVHVNLAKDELTGYLDSPDDASDPISGGLFNIRIGQIAGYAGLLEFLGGETFDQRQAVQHRLDAFWSQLCKLGNTDEDAENYDSLGMAFAIDLARFSAVKTISRLRASTGISITSATLSRPRG